jgi:hypothetical protein
MPPTLSAYGHDTNTMKAKIEKITQKVIGRLQHPGKGQSHSICSEAAAQIAAVHFGAGPLDRQRRDIDSEYVETQFGQPNCIRAGPRADLKRRGWRDATRSDELDEQRFWLRSVPGQPVLRRSFHSMMGAALRSKFSSQYGVHRLNLQCWPTR